MEDEEALLENDPLAVYLNNEKLHEFEKAKINYNTILVETEFKNNSKKKEFVLTKEYFYCFEQILKSELLLEEDYKILDIYYSNNLIYLENESTLNALLYLGTLPLIGCYIWKFSKFRSYFFSAVCTIPLIFKCYKFIVRRLKERKINLLIKSLCKISSSTKKCLRKVGEVSASLSYFSSESINNSSLNKIYMNFIKDFHEILLNIISILVHFSSEIMKLFPLIIDNQPKYIFNKNLFLRKEVNISDLKVLYELYLLIQSDFLRILGLSFCSYLWSSKEININNTYAIIAKLNFFLNDKLNLLEIKLKVIKNYGIKRSVNRPIRKYYSSDLKYMVTCLNNNAEHFQQLLCKTRDLLELLEDVHDIVNSDKSKLVQTILNEMEKQINSSQNSLESVIKYHNQLIKKTADDFEDKPVLNASKIQNDIKTVEEQLEDLEKLEKKTYELYIPKEGLDLPDLENDDAIPEFSVKNLEYSLTLLDELRTTLKARNPDVFAEEEELNKQNEIASDSEEEDFSYKSRGKNIFRPMQQPTGLAENLRSINHILEDRIKRINKNQSYEDTFE